MNSIIQLRIPAKLRRSLFRAADAAGLTLNAYITRLLAAAIKEKEHEEIDRHVRRHDER